MLDSPSRDYEKNYEEKRDIIPHNYDNVILPDYKNEEDKFFDKNEYPVEHWKIIPYFEKEKEVVKNVNDAADKTCELQDMVASQIETGNLSGQESLDKLNKRYEALNKQRIKCEEELQRTRQNLLAMHEIDKLPPFGSNITPIV